MSDSKKAKSTKSPKLRLTKDTIRKLTEDETGAVAGASIVCTAPCSAFQCPTLIACITKWPTCPKYNE